MKFCKVMFCGCKVMFGRVMWLRGAVMYCRVDCGCISCSNGMVEYGRVLFSKGKVACSVVRYCVVEVRYLYCLVGSS